MCLSLALRHRLRQRRQVRVCIDITHIGFDRERFTQLVCQVCRQQRMPAQREEIIVGADMIDFQQPAPQIGDDPLVAVERFSRGRPSLGRQGQQRRLVDFTVGVDRQPIQMPVLGGQK